MKKIYITILSSLLSLMIYSQTIENLSISQSSDNSLDIALEVCEINEIGFLSYSYEVNNDIIDLSVCYWFNEATAVVCDEQNLQITIPPENNDYTLNVEIYNSISQQVCDFNELTDTAMLDFSTPVNGTVILSNSDSSFDNRISIYPNPVEEVLYIKNNSGIDLKVIKVYNILGELVLKLTDGLDRINLSQLKSGILFVNIETQKEITIKKIIKN
jgi:hypothetical protein